MEKPCHKETDQRCQTLPEMWLFLRKIFCSIVRFLPYYKNHSRKQQTAITPQKSTGDGCLPWRAARLRCLLGYCAICMSNCSVLVGSSASAVYTLCMLRVWIWETSVCISSADSFITFTLLCASAFFTVSSTAGSA